MRLGPAGAAAEGLLCWPTAAEGSVMNGKSVGIVDVMCLWGVVSVLGRLLWPRKQHVKDAEGVCRTCR